MNAPWMGIARAELGQKELRGTKNNNPRILQYLKTVGHWNTDETAWCSAFVNWVMTQSGIRGTNAANARSWLRWGYPSAYPEYGCITVFSRGNSSWQGHVAFYIKQEGSSIVVLGGNQGNAVSVRAYARSRLLGYRWPNPVGEIHSGGHREPIEGMEITARRPR